MVRQRHDAPIPANDDDISVEFEAWAEREDAQDEALLLALPAPLVLVPHGMIADSLSATLVQAGLR